MLNEIVHQLNGAEKQLHIATSYFPKVWKFIFILIILTNYFNLPQDLSMRKLRRLFNVLPSRHRVFYKFKKLISQLGKGWKIKFSKIQTN